MVQPTKTKKKTTASFVVKCATPVNDGIFELKSFEMYLTQRIKVNGRPGDLGEAVKVESDSRTKEVRVEAKLPFSKRYVKYLTKKFLKKHELRDYIRVIADNKGSYDLRYFNIQADEE